MRGVVSMFSRAVENASGILLLMSLLGSLVLMALYIRERGKNQSD